MKKTIFTLTVLAILTFGCNQATKKQAGNENIPSDSIFVITETCLTLQSLQEQDFKEEEAEAFYDFLFYSAEAGTNFKKLGINVVSISKRYLSFALDNGKNYLADTKKQSIFEAFLYKKGEKPISIHIVNNDWKAIADYLQIKESEIIKLIEATEENHTK